MKKTAEEIIKIVEWIQNNTRELNNMKNAYKSYENKLKEFEDTGNSWIRVSYCHGTNWESPYNNGQNPSERVREAVVADIKENMEKLQGYIKAQEVEIQKHKDLLEE